MSAKTVFFLSSFLLTVDLIFGSTGNEFFCKSQEDKYHVCRTCNEILFDCETKLECQCGNIQIQNANTGTLEGGSDCSTADEEGNNWCFTSSGVCDDGEDVEIPDDDQIWHKNGIQKSYDACSVDYYVDFEIGNEEFIMGMEITEDALKGFTTNGTEGDNLSLYFEEYEECQKECKSRVGFCGAWTFDDLEGICYLFNVNACCGQKHKREANPNFISGYVCPICSSTKDECPCTINERKGQHSSAAQSTGADETDYNSPTGIVRIDWIDTNKDPCACEYRTFKRRRISKCRCTKPQCKDEVLNPMGTCEDKRRCRKRRLNPRRFEPCKPQ